MLLHVKVLMQKFKLIIGLVIFTVFTSVSVGGFQLKEFIGIVKDLNGKVLHAKIEFYNLGTHDHVGNLHSDSTSGTFKVKFKNNVSYSISISAHGYFSKYMIVDVHDSIILHEFPMVPITKGIKFPLDNLLFNQGQHLINEESFAEIDNLINFMKINPEVVIQIEGHTDYMGSKSANHDLALRRIHEVKNYMVFHSIKKKRIQIKSFGGSSPLVISQNSEERKVNRRVEVRIIQIKY